MSFISYLINGISLGSVYAIIALGYTMVYGIAKMLNFAHGDVIMIGAYVVLTAMTSAGLPAYAAVLIAVVFCTLLGMLIERVAYKPLRNAASPLAVLITAIGVSYLLQNIALLIFGANTKSFTSVVPIPPVVLADGNLTITGETIMTIAACIVIMIGLTVFIKKSKSGQAMLAVSEDRGAAQLMGINVNKTIALTFAIGSALAAIAGVLLCSAYPTLTPYTGAMPGNQSICGGGIRRDRFDSGRNDRWDTAWCDRDFRKSIYFIPDGGCDRIWRTDHRAARKTCRNPRQEYSGESVGERNEKDEKNNKKQSNHLRIGDRYLSGDADFDHDRKYFQSASGTLGSALLLCDPCGFFEPDGRDPRGTESWSCGIYVCGCVYKRFFLKMYGGCDTGCGNPLFSGASDRSGKRRDLRYFDWNPGIAVKRGLPCDRDACVW